MKISFLSAFFNTGVEIATVTLFYSIISFFTVWILGIPALPGAVVAISLICCFCNYFGTFLVEKFKKSSDGNKNEDKEDEAFEEEEEEEKKEAFEEEEEEEEVKKEKSADDEYDLWK
jgi:flagellar biosynthesis component FlhA